MYISYYNKMVLSRTGAYSCCLHASGSDEDCGLGLLDYEEFEVDMGQLTKVVKVEGCLKQCEQFWRDTFHSPSFMTSIVRNGYIPPLYVFPPPLSAFAHAEFVTACRDCEFG